jgi:iron complex transport system permease protein
MNLPAKSIPKSSTRTSLGLQRLTPRQWIRINLLLGAAFAVTLLFCSNSGPTRVRLWETFSIWLNRANPDLNASLILWHVRLPRILLAALVGAGLALSGATFQAILQNPLAEPFILGISGGAALGGVLGIVLNLSETWPHLWFLPLLSFGGAMLAMLLIYSLAARKDRISPTSLLLIGVIFNSFTSAIILFISSIIDASQLQSVMFWLMGDLQNIDYPMILAVAGYILVGFAILMFQARNLNLLVFGDDLARQGGICPDRTRKIAFFTAAFLTATVVSVSGMIGFVGLAIPHMVRALVGSDHRLLLPACFWSGAIFLMIADTLARTLLAPVELPVGVITALVGGPFFMVLIRKSRRSIW